MEVITRPMREKVKRPGVRIHSLKNKKFNCYDKIKSETRKCGWEEKRADVADGKGFGLLIYKRKNKCMSVK